jgi:hypothetical protein
MIMSLLIDFPVTARLPKISAAYIYFWEALCEDIESHNGMMFK